MTLGAFYLTILGVCVGAWAVLGVLVALIRWRERPRWPRLRRVDPATRYAWHRADNYDPNLDRGRRRPGNN